MQNAIAYATTEMDDKGTKVSGRHLILIKELGN